MGRAVELACIAECPVLNHDDDSRYGRGVAWAVVEWQAVCGVLLSTAAQGLELVQVNTS